MRRLSIVLALITLFGTSCSNAGAPSPATSPAASVRAADIGLAISSAERAPATGDDATAAAAAINDFGIDLYRALAAGDNNLVLSPTSIAIALGMARPGARGQTATEMDTVLHDVASDENANWLNSLDQALAKRSGSFADVEGDDAEVELRLPNAAFAQAGFPLEDAYLDAIASRFDAGLQLVDFIGDTDAARLAINDWVARETEERIPELVAPGVLDRGSRLALVNAIYLKAQWFVPFERELTHDAPFITADGTTVSVPTMSTITPMRHGEGAGWRAVELPYVGESLAMTIVVPDDLGAFEERLDGDLLASITGALRDQRLELTLPRFGVETIANLNQVLIELGMPLAFDPDLADFSGISPNFDGPMGRLHIRDVVHQANIDVDEYGTEAAAATAVIIGFLSEAPTFNVDRPFLFAVRDTQTGAVLFLGRVTDPSISP